MNRCVLGVLIATAATSAAPSAASGQALTVYSSLPLSGAARAQSKAVNDGARLALQEAGGTAAGRTVRLVTLNDATNRAGSWTPERVSSNARRAAQDESTVAYIGELNSVATRISLPILNEAGIPMISPGNTYIGLTTDGPGTEPGEPDKYYPTGERTYFRLLPNDTVQAAALATAMRDRGCTKVASLHDGEQYGRGMSTIVRADAARLGLQVVATRRTSRRARSYRGVARIVRRAQADCVVYTGITANGAVRLFRDIGRGLPKAQLFGSDGIAESGFADPREGGVPTYIGRRVIVSVATLASDAYGTPNVFARNGDPFTIYGYEAMKLILDGLDAGGAGRTGVLGFLRGVQGRASVLGTYGFDAKGDTTLRTYGLYTIRGRSLTWVGAVTAA